MWLSPHLNLQLSLFIIGNWLDLESTGFCGIYHRHTLFVTKVLSFSKNTNSRLYSGRHALTHLPHPTHLSHYPTGENLKVHQVV